MGKEKVPQHVPQPTAATCGNYVALQIKPRASTATTT
jgi:hypothetical protein